MRSIESFCRPLDENAFGHFRQYRRRSYPVFYFNRSFLNTYIGVFYFVFCISQLYRSLERCTYETRTRLLGGPIRSDEGTRGRFQKTRERFNCVLVHAIFRLQRTLHQTTTESQTRSLCYRVYFYLHCFVLQCTLSHAVVGNGL